ncbi:MAG: alpha-E domain-containing protein, partial [Cypionkella sp.]
ELGRRLERAIQIARITAWLTDKEAPDGSLEMLLEIGDSVMSHRRRYSVTAGTQSAVDLLVLDPLNPRSVLFQLTELREQIEMLPGGVDDGQLSPAAKAALQLHTDLVIAEPSDMTPARLEQLAADLGMLSSLVAAAYFV